MTNIDAAEKVVNEAKARLSKACADNSGPTIQQFEKVWGEFGTGSEQADRLDFVAEREDERKDKEYRAAKNNLLHAEGLLRVAKTQEVTK